MTDEAQAAADDLPGWAAVTLPDGRLAYRVAGSRGVTAEVFAARIRGGWSPERAAYEPAARMRASAKRPRASLLRSVRLKNGKLAWPVAAAAGMSEATFRSRLARGLSPDEAATLPVVSPSQAARSRLHPAQKRVGWSALRRLVLSDGRAALAVANESGLSVETFRARLRRGWSVDRAALEPPQRRLARMAGNRRNATATEAPERR